MIIEIKERRTLSTRSSKGRMIFLTFGVNEISRQDFDRMISVQGIAKKMLDAGTLVIVQDDSEPVSRETVEPVTAIAEPEKSVAKSNSSPPPPLGSPPKQSQSVGDKSIADMDIKSAVLLVRQANDRAELEKLFNIEKREAVLKAISNKLDELQSK